MLNDILNYFFKKKKENQKIEINPTSELIKKKML